MNQRGGFSYTDYDVMDRSCNTFTYELSKRLNLAEKYPIGRDNFKLPEMCLQSKSAHAQPCYEPNHNKNMKQNSPILLRKL